MTIFNYQREDVRALKPYEKDWPHGYCTRSGNPARLIADDLKQHSYPLAWVVGQFDTDLYASRLDGRISEYGDQPGDIMCAMPPPMRRWYALNKAGNVWSVFDTEAKATEYMDNLSPDAELRLIEMKEVR